MMHDGMPYGRIQGQGQGHEPLKVWIPSREVDRQFPTGLIFITVIYMYVYIFVEHCTLMCCLHFCCL